MYTTYQRFREWSGHYTLTVGVDTPRLDAQLCHPYSDHNPCVQSLCSRQRYWSHGGGMIWQTCKAMPHHLHFCCREGVHVSWYTQKGPTLQCISCLRKSPAVSLGKQQHHSPVQQCSRSETTPCCWWVLD